MVRKEVIARDEKKEETEEELFNEEFDEHELFSGLDSTSE